VNAFAAGLRPFGPANFLYSDGDALFAHGGRRKSSSTGTVAAPGLVFLQHQCAPTGTAITGSGITVTGKHQFITLVASVPLTAEPWQALAEGEVTVFQAGRINGKRRIDNT
jgi:glutamine amidotransferase